MTCVVRERFGVLWYSVLPACVSSFAHVPRPSGLMMQPTSGRQIQEGVPAGLEDPGFQAPRAFPRREPRAGPGALAEGRAALLLGTQVAAEKAVTETPRGREGTLSLGLLI